MPRGATEGKVLRVAHELDAAGEHSTLRITVDRTATDRALDASRAQVDAVRKASGSRDLGGDVKL